MLQMINIVRKETKNIYMYIFNLLPHLGYLILADEFLPILVKNSMARKVRIYWKRSSVSSDYSLFFTQISWLSRKINLHIHQYSILKPQTLLHRNIWQRVYGRRGVLNQRATSVFASDAGMEGRDPLGVSGSGMLAGRGWEGMVIICFAHPFSSISPS